MTGTKMMLDVTNERFAQSELGDQHWHIAWEAHQRGDKALRNEHLSLAAEHFRAANCPSMVLECEDFANS